MAPAEDDGRFRSQCKCESRRVDLRLGDVEGELGALARAVEIAAEPVVPREPCSEHGQILVRLVARDDREGTLHPLASLVAPAGEGLDLAEHRERASGCVRVSLLLVQLDRLAEQPTRLVGLGGSPRHLAGAAEERGPTDGSAVSSAACSK